MTNFKYLSVLMLFFLFPFSVLADTDPWYITQPSCVIDRGNPERTGEYKAETLNSAPSVLWETPPQNIINKYGNEVITLCYQNKIFTGTKAFDVSTGKIVWQAPNLALNSNKFIMGLLDINE